MRIDEITSRITGDLGREILFYDTVGSTNTVASDLAAKSREGTVVLADSQEKGRGRLGRLWVSPPGVNIYMSIILKPETEPRHAPLITLTVAVACATALIRTTGLNVTIKWPNDLIVSDRKLGGILTEVKTEQRKIVAAVVGIGINVNMDVGGFPEDIRAIATSIKNETGTTHSREVIAAEILNEMNRWYTVLKENDRETILSQWEQLNSTLGREVMVTAGQETYTGFAEAIDHEGMLLLRLPSGEMKRISSGDLTILR